jgi:hypothetical protein
MKIPGAWDCPVEERYRAPQGYYDSWFDYVWDFDRLPAASIGTPVSGIVLPLDGDAGFLLRRVAGAATLNTVAPLGFQIYDAVGRRFFSAAEDPTQVYTQDLAIAPEKEYPKSGHIQFDLANFQPLFRASGPTPASGIFLGQILFQGVKRYQGALAKPDYTYREEVFVYRTQFTLNWNAYVWAGGLPVTRAAPVKFTVRIDDYPFELLSMQLFDMATGLYPAALDPAFAMTVYDRNGKAMSNQPVLCRYLFANANVAVPGMYSRFSPGIVYETGSQLRFDISSLLLNADFIPVAPTYEICFAGVRRKRA